MCICTTYFIYGLIWDPFCTNFSKMGKKLGAYRYVKTFVGLEKSKPNRGVTARCQTLWASRQAHCCQRPYLAEKPAALNVCPLALGLEKSPSSPSWLQDIERRLCKNMADSGQVLTADSGQVLTKHSPLRCKIRKSIAITGFAIFLCKIRY